MLAMVLAYCVIKNKNYGILLHFQESDSNSTFPESCLYFHMESKIFSVFFFPFWVQNE